MSGLKFREEREEGFTLIELLVVVIIIGILAAIAIPTFLNQRRSGWQAELTSNVRNTALDLEAAATTNSGNPPAVNGTNGLPTGIGVDATNTNYFYAVDGTAWCLAGTSNRDLSGSVVYQSGSGIEPFSESGTLTCTPGAGEDTDG